VTVNEAVVLILEELKKAEDKWPIWQTDPIHAQAVVMEEAGEALKATNDLYNGNGDINKVIKEVAHTGAMAIRFLVGLPKYNWGLRAEKITDEDRTALHELLIPMKCKKCQRDFQCFKNSPMYNTELCFDCHMQEREIDGPWQG